MLEERRTGVGEEELLDGVSEVRRALACGRRTARGEEIHVDCARARICCRLVGWLGDQKKKKKKRIVCNPIAPWWVLQQA